MKKETKLFVVTTILLVVTIATVFSVTRWFAAKGAATQYTKKTFFQFNLNTGFYGREMSPGETDTVDLRVVSDATEEMYIFMKLTMPHVGDEPLYTYKLGDDWILVEHAGNTYVYAYANDTMIRICPGEETTSLTKQLKMRQISIPQYAYIEDINLSVVAYALGATGTSENPSEAWAECKEVGGLLVERQE